MIQIQEEEYLAWTENVGVMIFLHSRFENIFSDSPRYFAIPQTGTQFIIFEVNL